MCKPEHASDVFYLREAGDKLMSTRPNSRAFTMNGSAYRKTDS